VKKLVKCKACGYIIAEEKLGDKCPACGVPRQMFESYTDPVGESRRSILNMDLHPIAVHFPTAFAVAVLVFSISIFFFSGQIREILICTIKLIALLLPLLVLIAFLAGLLDGKTRFRRLGHSQILKSKMFYGIFFFIFSVALALVVWLKGFDSVVLTWVVVLLAAAGVGCNVVLALLGTKILNAVLPGK
jgi:uncharacterized membrane protein/rubredoxin